MLQPSFEIPAGDIATAEAEREGKRQANRTEHQDESPDYDLGSYVEDLEDRRDYEDYRPDVGSAPEGWRLFKARVCTGGSGDGFQKIREVKTEDQDRKSTRLNSSHR